MYIPQPEKYYEELSLVACDVVEIPRDQAAAILDQPCLKTKELRKWEHKSYKFDYEALAYSEQIRLAKQLVFYYLWINKIKSPQTRHNYKRYIRAVENKIQAGDNEQFNRKYEQFMVVAGAVAKYDIKKEIVYTFIPHCA